LIFTPDKSTETNLTAFSDLGGHIWHESANLP
jgi:hypothetical protein